MIKKFPFLLVLVVSLIACETEDFDSTIFEPTNDTVVTDDTDNPDDTIDIIDDSEEDTNNNEGDTTNDNSCSVPQNITIEIISGQTANLRLPLQTNESSAIDPLEVKLLDNESNTIVSEFIITSDNINTFIIINDLTPSTTYFVTIRKICSTDSFSEWSDEIQITTL